MTRPNFEARLKGAALNFAANQADSRVGAGARWAHDEARAVDHDQLDAAAASLYRTVVGAGRWDDTTQGEQQMWRARAADALRAAGLTVPEEED